MTANVVIYYDGYYGDNPEQGKKDVITVPDFETGGRRCAVRFNPDENPDVRCLKWLAAAFITECARIGARDIGEDGQRCIDAAMMDAESAQMFAVKAVFAKRNAGEAG